MPHGAGFPGYFPSTPPRLYPVHQQLWQSQQRMQELQRRAAGRLAPSIHGSVACRVSRLQVSREGKSYFLGHKRLKIWLWKSFKVSVALDYKTPRYKFCYCLQLLLAFIVVGSRHFVAYDCQTNPGFTHNHWVPSGIHVILRKLKLILLKFLRKAKQVKS